MRIAAASITGEASIATTLPPGCTRSASARDGSPVPHAASRMICLGFAPLALQNQRLIEANTTAFQSCHFSQPLR
jgi:hypothetical protein